MASGWEALSLYTIDNTLVEGATVSDTEHNTHRANVHGELSEAIIAGVQAQRNFSDSSAPDDTSDGVTWYDSGNDVLKARISAAWVELVDATNDQTIGGEKTFSDAVTFDSTIDAQNGGTLGGDWAGNFITSGVLTNQNQIRIDSSFPLLRISETDAGTDQKRWFLYANSEILRIALDADAGGDTTDILQVNRSGTSGSLTADSWEFLSGFVQIDDTTAGSASGGALNIPNGGARIEGDSYFGGASTFSHATGVTADNVTERSSDNGVDVDGVLLKDGIVTAQRVRTGGSAITDDAAQSFSVGSTGGSYLVVTIFESTGGTINTATFSVSTANSLECNKLTDPSNAFEASTGALNGTTGNDLKVTVSADTDTIYVENRLGSSKVCDITLLG